jgi:ubiquinone/menaquinone biosynthesis C-methylase UbiE
MTEKRSAFSSITERIRSEFIKGNENRDYTIYTGLMDAALEAKTKSLFPHFGRVHQGMTIVDAGSGTGAVAELAAKYFRGTHVYALDISHELMDRAEGGRGLTQMVFGDAANQNFPDNSVDIKFFSTSGHEVESYGGQGRMTTAVKTTYDELRPGGKLVIRDFAKPAGKEPIYMQILSEGGVEDPAEATDNGFLDYSLLSTKALFHRFHEEFAGGDAFDYEQVSRDGQEYIKVLPEWAHEFYLRKDYTANWRQEIREKYTYWTENQAEEILTNAGYTDIKVIPDPSDYIVQNRLKGKIALFDEDEQGQLQEIPFPATHMLVVGTKPAIGELASQVFPAPDIRVAKDYADRMKSISIDQEQQRVIIGNEIFQLKNVKEASHGTKKTTYRLAGEPARVLKVAKTDALNEHAAFKAMYQSIEREAVLDEHNVPHAHILSVDPQGHPYRYYIQEAIADDAQSAADLIRNNALTETDIAQMARHVTKFELGKKWQLDTNPFNWYRVPGEDGSSQMTYVDGKVYRYDESWEFRRIGLLQWLTPEYITDTPEHSAAIPKAKDYEALQKSWESSTDESVLLWKRHLHPHVQPAT